MRRERGFSLAELLAALLILTVVITVSMAAFLERNRRQQQARELIAVYQVLANEAEHWRRIPYNQLGDPPLEFRSDTQLLGILGGYGTAVGVVDVEPPNVKRVTLTVRWQNGKREARVGIVRVNTGGGPLW
jgi:prepilin-type N-terminal cleavage/methylation domain-containing protein